LSTVTNYTGLLIRADSEDQVEPQAHRALDPLTHLKHEAERHRAEGVEVEEVVIEVGDDRRVLTFEEFCQQYG
jgi:hypothetical protein